MQVMQQGNGAQVTGLGNGSPPIESMDRAPGVVRGQSPQKLTSFFIFFCSQCNKICQVAIKCH